MARHLPFALLALALFMPPLLAGPAAAAPGLSLAWDHCRSEATSAQHKTFACDTNSGSETLVGSFALTFPVDRVAGTEIVLQLVPAGGVIPAWWQFKNVGSCRVFSLTANPNHDPADLSCPNWSGGQMVTEIASYCVSSTCAGDPGQSRVVMFTAVPPPLEFSLGSIDPYFAFNLRIDHARTVGTGACAGCDVPVCIAFSSIKVNMVGTNYRHMFTFPAFPGSEYVTWQGGGANCPGVTPTRNSTWGAVKSLYR
jgi:hypothetical protein